MKDNIKKNQIKDNTRLPKLSDTIGTTNNKSPLYSFLNFCDSEHGLSADPTEIVELLKHLKKLEQTTWQVIQGSQRHGMGSEEIEKKQLKEKLPEKYKELKNVLAFRYSGKKAFIGVRENQTLNILFIDPKFDLYEH